MSGLAGRWRRLYVSVNSATIFSMRAFARSIALLLARYQPRGRLSR